MKYLSLVNNESNTSSFSVPILPNGINVGANAKIALEQINLEFQKNDIIIDATNDSFQFNPYARTGRPPTDIGPQAVTATLAHGTYATVTDVILALENAINSAMRIWNRTLAGAAVKSQYDNYQGVQFYAYLQNDRFRLSFAHVEPTLNNDFLYNNVINNGAVAGDASQVWYVKNAGNADAFDGVFQSKLPLSKSNCIITSTFNLLDKETDFIIGVSDQVYDLTAPVFDLTKYKIAVYSTSTAGDNSFWVKIGNNAAVAFTGILKTAGGANTIKTLAITWGMYTDTATQAVTPKVKVSLKVGDKTGILTVNHSKLYDFDFLDYASKPAYFTCSTQQLNQFYLLQSVPNGANQPLAMVLNAFQTKENVTGHILQSIPQHIKLNNIKIDDDFMDDNIEAYTGGNRAILFNSGLNEILGFNRAGYVYSKFEENSFFTADQNIPSYISINGFKPKNLLIQTPLLDLESYSNTGLRNVLALVPNDDVLGTELTYRPNEKLFIDLKNKKPDTISSIRFFITDDQGALFNVLPNSLNISLVISDDSDKKY